MTERLYLADPYLTRFEAEVLEERQLGGRSALVLSRTAFYPEGGGQPADLGTLGGARVVDVQEVEGEVLHVVEGAFARGVVAGEVDWARRFDHMQQHHGQHLLSAAFEAALGAPTISFHLGAESCTIDLDLPSDRLGPAALEEIERLANRSVWRDLPVEARDFAPEELARLCPRREPTRGCRLVVVREGGSDGGRLGEEGTPPGIVDASPCGGTHPRRTGEVGAIAVVRAQRWGAGSRVEFVCGARVMRTLRLASDRLGEVAEALRCAPHEAAAAAVRLAAESLGRGKQLDRLMLVLAQSEAERLMSEEDPITLEVRAPGDDAAAFLRAVGQVLAGRGRCALLGARAGGRAYLCFARPRGAGPDLAAALREAAGVVGGKGGGAPDLAQGGGPEVRKLGEALALARSALWR